jgi:DNA-binding response OmpR family regulator
VVTKPRLWLWLAGALWAMGATVLSAHAMTGDRDMALAAGGDDFDTKPIRFQSLLGKIESLLSGGVSVS